MCAITLDETYLEIRGIKDLERRSGDLSEAFPGAQEYILTSLADRTEAILFMSHIVQTSTADRPCHPRSRGRMEVE